MKILHRIMFLEITSILQHQSRKKFTYTPSLSTFPKPTTGWRYRVCNTFSLSPPRHLRSEAITFSGAFTCARTSSGTWKIQMAMYARAREPGRVMAHSKSAHRACGALRSVFDCTRGTTGLFGGDFF